jgi:hypothetical protein
VSATIPTISRQASGPMLTFTRLPMGLSFPKNRLANASLMTPTRGALGPSWSVNVRPRITRMPIASK